MRDTSGNDVDGAIVSLVHGQGSTSSAVLVIGSLEPGRSRTFNHFTDDITAVVWAPGHQTIRVPIEPYSYETLVIALTPGQDDRLLQGRVVDGEGEPVPESVVYLHNNTSMISLARTDSAGQFELGVLEDGNHTLKVIWPGSDIYPGSGVDRVVIDNSTGMVEIEAAEPYSPDQRPKDRDYAERQKIRVSWMAVSWLIALGSGLALMVSIWNGTMAMPRILFGEE